MLVKGLRKAFERMATAFKRPCKMLFPGHACRVMPSVAQRLPIGCLLKSEVTQLATRWRPCLRFPKAGRSAASYIVLAGCFIAHMLASHACRVMPCIVQKPANRLPSKRSVRISIWKSNWSHNGQSGRRASEHKGGRPRKDMPPKL